MPWKVTCLVNERMRLITRLEAGEGMTELCREFGISNKTGYKFWNRYLKLGPVGLYDQSRRPVRSPRQTPPEIQKLILDLKQEKPHWGAAKLRSYLLRRDPQMRIPKIHAIHLLLDRNGLVKRRKQRLNRGSGERFQKNLAVSESPNHLWCADFKGQFRLGNGKYCYPLTLTDHYSRYLLLCEGLESTRENESRAALTEVFQEYGLPRAIRTDNGTPFSSRGLYGLSQLSIWWLRLGIELQRSEPGHPEQNGRHERMHLTLKLETTRPSASNFLQQQERFDLFQNEFNRERPHEALGMRAPADVYTKSDRPFPKTLLPPAYPFHDLTLRVQSNGIVSLGRNFRFSLGQALAGEEVGLREEDQDLWRVSFMNLDLGFFDLKAKQFNPLPLGQPTSG
jgi:transposase InsO family protein